MMGFLQTIAIVVGVFVISYFVLGILVEFLRSFYWAFWTMIPEAKCHPDRVTIRRVVRHLWYQTWDEFFSGFQYNDKSCKYWVHGYWPWDKPREWYYYEEDEIDER